MDSENETLNIGPKGEPPSAAASATLAAEASDNGSMPKPALVQKTVLRADHLKVDLANDSETGSAGQGGVDNKSRPVLEKKPVSTPGPVNRKSKKADEKPKSSFRRLAALIVFLILATGNIFLYFLTRRELVRFQAIDKGLFLQEALRKENFSNQILEKIEILDKVFPEERGVVNFVAAVDKLSIGMEKMSLDFKSDQPVKDKIQPYLPFVLGAAGSPARVQQLTEKLLGSEFMIELTGFSVKSKDSFVNDAEAVIKANLYVSESFD